MDMLARPLALALLLGTLVMGIAAAVHPVLRGDAASHLRTIAESEHWRAIHGSMLAATGLIMVGIWVRLVTARRQPAPLIAALALITIGLATHSLNIVYMTGAGWQLATRYAAGEEVMAAIYGATHPIGLVASRYGNFLVALGAGVLGWVEWRDATAPRFLAWLAWAAAAAGVAGAAWFHETSSGIFAAVAVLSLWQAATGVRVLIAGR